jgi:hypothetical protein
MCEKTVPEDREVRQPAGLPLGYVVRHLTNLGRSSFGFDLARALDTARRAGIVSDAADAQAREHLISLRIKHESLAVIGRRVSTEWASVRKKALSSFDDAGCTLFIGRTEAIAFTADLEALIILLRSTLDGFVKLVNAIERNVLKGPQTPEDQLRSMPGVAQTERQLLRQARNAFAHGQAAWPAVVMVPGVEPDLAILARLQPDYDVGEGYILLSQVERWWKALDARLVALESELSERVRQLM